MLNQQRKRLRPDAPVLEHPFWSTNGHPDPKLSMMNKTNGPVERDSTLESARAARIKAAAARAKAEAGSRRLQAGVPSLTPEFHGRDGLEPVRYGDWEVRGLATDF